MLCLPCEQIMLIRLKQRKPFWSDLCPECRKKIKRFYKLANIG